MSPPDKIFAAINIIMHESHNITLTRRVSDTEMPNRNEEEVVDFSLFKNQIDSYKIQPLFRVMHIVHFHFYFHQGYVPLYQSWESFYTRNVYRRIRDCWNRVVASVPGTRITILDRISRDHGWTFEYVPWPLATCTFFFSPAPMLLPILLTKDTCSWNWRLTYFISLHVVARLHLVLFAFEFCHFASCFNTVVFHF